MNTSLTRRHLLQSAGCGFGSLAFSSLANAVNGGAPMLPARAKRAIFLFMQGGPSHVDTYDYKPELYKYHDKEVDFLVPRTRKVESRPVLQPMWDYAQYGESGHYSSSLFPEVAKHIDDLCFIHSMHTEGVAHGPSTIFLHTGSTNLVRPSMGAWISYGLGSENENLPAFVTVNPPATKGGPRNYGPAFLPARYQGTVLGQPGNPNALPEIRNIKSPVSDQDALKQHEFLSALNREQQQRNTGGDAVVDGMIESAELAWRMQNHASGIVDVDKESKETRELYGIGAEPTDGFGRQCLAARQLAEAGTRFVQISHCDNSSNPVWDQHSNMPKHEPLAKQVDKPIAGLLADLKRRGLLDDTLVWWGAEFGRTPFSQGKDGRDHNPRGFTTWLAGAGVKAGYAHGATDEFGFAAVQDKVHMHDLHATILHLMGLDHERLTYSYAGRDFRLTDVAGRVVKEVIG